MSNSWKKRISLLLVLALTAVCFTACGDSGSEASVRSEASVSSEPKAEVSESPAEPEAEESAALAEEEASVSAEEPEMPEVAVQYPISDETVEMSVYINVGDFMFNFTDNGDLNACAAIAAAEEATNVHINFTTISQDVYSDNYNLMLAGGDYYDIIARPGDYSKGLDGLIEDEIAIDLSDSLAQYAPDYLAYLTNTGESLKTVTTDEGHIVGFYPIQAIGFSIGPVIRQDWLDKLEMDIPRTYDELTEVLTAFHTEMGAESAIKISDSGFFDASTDFLNAGFGISVGSDGLAWFVDDGGQVHCSYVEEGFKEYLTLLNSWYNAGLFNEDAMYLTAQEIDPYVMGGNSGLFTANLSALSPDNQAGYDPEMNLVPISDISKTGDEQLGIGKCSASVSTDGGFFISTACQTPEYAMEYLNWYYTVEGAFTSNWGIEDEGYTLDENGNPVYTDLVVNNPDMFSLASQSIYTIWLDWPYPVSQEAAYALYTSEAQLTAYDTWITNRTGENIYYGTLSVEEGETYASVGSDIYTYAEENYMKFITGARSLDEFDDYVATIEGMGLSTLIEVKQAAYERYLER